MLTVLFIGAHADDVELGCLGAWFNHQRNGARIIYLCVRDSEELERNESLPDELERVYEHTAPDVMYRLQLDLLNQICF